MADEALDEFDRMALKYEKDTTAWKQGKLHPSFACRTPMFETTGELALSAVYVSIDGKKAKFNIKEDETLEQLLAANRPKVHENLDNYHIFLILKSGKRLAVPRGAKLGNEKIFRLVSKNKKK